ncbi:probable sodium/metabolite cotransporter BASS1, chloroplastic [Mangifera indica]|uniref:probable sodium/metabolite cotransporter BASS1, chloroplastic n=1 Tax=Mangifera indica TaxID=29780 RepID=UPI001CFAF144|nr:probable sodium/metabolite cotransporter BASS1, chloroplastic [Mangifera indica]
MLSSMSSPKPTLHFQLNNPHISTHPPTIKPQKLPSISCIRSSNKLIFTSQLSKSTWNPPTTFTLQSKLTNFSPKTCVPIRSDISSNSYETNNERRFREWIELIGEAISTAFPIWVSLGCLLGLMKPVSFNWVTPKWTILGLTLTMLGMGMTLSLDDLRGALSMPKEIISGFVLQYSVMPISGFLVSKLLNLPAHYAAGLILVGCCPGGTASNIVTYIARGNVALSVLMTAASTLFAVVMTPFLTAKLAGQYVAVDAAGLLMSTLQVVLLPVLAGAFLNQYFQSLVKFVSPLMPPIAVGTVAILCGNAIAQSSSAILMSGKQVVLAASLLHASGFFFGYVLARALGLDTASSRTISIEVGMQNSVLGVVLATQHFGNPLTAVPCAVSSVCQSIFGSVLAGFWRRTAPAPK